MEKPLHSNKNKINKMLCEMEILRDSISASLFAASLYQNMSG